MTPHISTPLPDSDLTPAFVLFGEMLERRFARRVNTSEDAIRYTFFLALFQALSVQPEDVILEHDHGTIARAKIDTWIPLLNGRSYAVEFKYDRPIPSGSSLPLTQKAGHLIKDLFRLAKLDLELRAYGVFVYVATDSMVRYFSNPNNGLSDLFQLPHGETIAIGESYLAARASTLLRTAGEPTSCAITTLFSKALPNGHVLRIFDVRPSKIV